MCLDNRFDNNPGIFDNDFLAICLAPLYHIVVTDKHVLLSGGGGGCRKVDIVHHSFRYVIFLYAWPSGPNRFPEKIQVLVCVLNLCSLFLLFS